MPKICCKVVFHGFHPHDADFEAPRLEGFKYQVQGFGDSPEKAYHDTLDEACNFLSQKKWDKLADFLPIKITQLIDISPIAEQENFFYHASIHYN